MDSSEDGSEAEYGDTDEPGPSAKNKKRKGEREDSEAPLTKAKGRKKSEAPEKEKRKKAKEADIPALPETVVLAKLACDQCLRRERPCFFKNQEDADDGRASCWDCKARHVACRPATVVSTGFNILQIRLGQFGTRRRGTSCQRDGR